MVMYILAACKPKYSELLNIIYTKLCSNPNLFLNNVVCRAAKPAFVDIYFTLDGKRQLEPCTARPSIGPTAKPQRRNLGVSYN